MPDLSITFHPDVPQDRREELLKEFLAWHEVEDAGYLFPGSTDRDPSRMAYAPLRDDGDVMDDSTANGDIVVV